VKFVCVGVAVAFDLRGPRAPTPTFLN